MLHKREMLVYQITNIEEREGGLQSTDAKDAHDLHFLPT